MDNSTEFRPIQYLGSKWRVLDQVEQAVDSVSKFSRPLTVDLFSGSGVVSRRLARSRPVLASDIQEYSRVLASALLNPAPVEPAIFGSQTQTQGNYPWLDALISEEINRANSPGWADYLSADIESGSLAAEIGDWPTVNETPARRDAALLSKGSSKWNIFRHYGGVFFSYQQAAELDLIAERVRELDGMRRDTAMAALLGTATDIVSSVGSHFAQPIRPRDANGRLKIGQLRLISDVRRKKATLIFLQRLERLSSLGRTKFPGTAVRDGFDNVLGHLPASAGTVYADPPYTREHYSRFYHVLETIAIGDDPGVSTVNVGGAKVPSRGLYRVNRHQSPFSIISQAPGAFSSLFEEVAGRDLSLVLSYSPTPENDKPRARVIQLEPLVSLARKSFGRVDVLAVSGVRHSKFNHKQLNAPAVDEAEVLIVAS